MKSILYRTRAYMELFEQPLKCTSIMLDNVDPMAVNRTLLNFFLKGLCSTLLHIHCVGKSRD
jgi:hypothetical protein